MPIPKSPSRLRREEGNKLQNNLKRNKSSLNIELQINDNVNTNIDEVDMEIYNILNNPQEFSDSLDGAISDEELNSGRKTNAEKMFCSSNF